MSVQTARLNTALLTVFKPLARMLLVEGVSCKASIELLKDAFVEVATADYGKRDRPASISRVAELTGLTRKDVKRLRESTIDKVPTNDFYAIDASEILAFWHRDERFLDAKSRPKPLSLGPGPGTFTDLVESATGDSSALQYLSHLSKVGSVAVAQDGLISLVRRELIIAEDLPRLIGIALGPLASTIAYNLGKEPDDGLCQRSVYSARIDPKHVDMFRRIARDRIISFVEELDDYLTGFESDGSKSFQNREGRDLLRIGVGAYFFEVERESE